MFPIDAFRATLEKAVALFQQHSIRFHLTGGITTVIYGQPRMTQDIDVVIDNRAVTDSLEPFLAALDASDFMYDADAVCKAVAEKGMFQLLDRQESIKLDIYPRELIPGELDRSVEVEIFEGRKLPITSRPDAAASKLVWISKGSHKSRPDLRRICDAATDDERQLIQDLASQLGLQALLDEVLGESDELD